MLLFFNCETVFCVRTEMANYCCTENPNVSEDEIWENSEVPSLLVRTY